MKNSSSSFYETLNVEADIYKELSFRRPDWWELFINDRELYIDIRKDNSINVYYYGGSVAKITYNKRFKAETHWKYLDGKEKGKSEYIELDLDILCEKYINNIKANIKREYLKTTNIEKPAEKWIQGKLITETGRYIDSEFQFNKNEEIGNLRIDLVELTCNQLSFVELKGITDSRLRNDEKRNPNPPEIIEQIKKYQLFINRYFLEIENYYKSLISLKNKLGLTSYVNIDFSINRKPKVLIVNTYQKRTSGREKRILAIKKLLEENDISYEMIELADFLPHNHRMAKRLQE